MCIGKKGMDDRSYNISIGKLFIFIVLVIRLSTTSAFHTTKHQSHHHHRLNKQKVLSQLSMTSTNTQESSSSSSSSSSSTIRIISYNVLSSNLGGPDYFTSCKPENLDPLARRKKVINKIKTELKNCSKDKDINKPIFCLQEISHSWVGKFIYKYQT